MPSLLDDLKNEAGVNTGATKSSAPRRDNIPFEGLLQYCQLDYFKKQIEGMLKSHPVRKIIMGFYVETHRLLQSAPTESINGREKSGTANISMQKKNSQTKLDADTITLCKDLGISLRERMIISFKEDLEEDKINAALVALNKAGIDWRTLFNVDRRMLPSDQTLNDIFKLGENTTNERMAEIIEKVAGIVIRPKFNGELTEAFEACRLAFNPTAEEVAAMQAAAAAQAKSGDNTAPKASAKEAIMGALKASLEAEGGPVAPEPPKSRKRR